MMMRGSYLAAKGKYEEAVEAAPNVAVSYVNLASLVLRVSKNTQEAVALLHKAIQKDACCIQAYVLLIQVYTLMNKEKDIRIIRPFVYVREKQLREFAKTVKLPIIDENCPACFEGWARE